jgi:hypothetical protein
MYILHPLAFEKYSHHLALYEFAAIEDTAVAENLAVIY